MAAIKGTPVITVPADDEMRDFATEENLRLLREKNRELKSILGGIKTEPRRRVRLDAEVKEKVHG